MAGSSSHCSLDRRGARFHTLPITPDSAPRAEGAPYPLTASMEEFVRHWGEMGSRWGVNRSVTRVHALLYLAGEPLDAETIAATLGVARSNVSTCLRELGGWTLVGMTHINGDRRDHFEAELDVWTIAAAVLDGRRRRAVGAA